MTSGSQFVSTTATTAGAACWPRDGDVLLLRVDHEDRIWRPVQPAQATKVPVELLELALVRERLFLRHRGEVAGSTRCLELHELANAAATVWKLVSMPPSQRWLT